MAKKIYPEAKKKYAQSDKGKEVQKKAVAKSQCKKFITEMATVEDIQLIENWISKRKQNF